MTRCWRRASASSGRWPSRRARPATGRAARRRSSSTPPCVRCRRSYDEGRGGFGDAPKFPPSMVLELLLRHHARTGDAEALRMVEGTCEAMARGGIYDQLAGGFARYSVDADWVVPHFEKMLYDNALLLRVYTHLWRATGSAMARRVALETGDWMLRELRTPEGGFASALDADTEGVEGLTYAWTPEQLAEVLGADDGAWAAGLLTVTPRRDLRARCVDAAAAGGPGRPVAVGRRPAAAAGGARRAAAAGPGRQGGGGLERAGHRGPGRGRLRCWTGRTWSAAAVRRGRAAARRARRRRAAAPGVPGRCGRRAATASSRTTPTWPRGCSPCSP